MACGASSTQPRSRSGATQPISVLAVGAPSDYGVRWSAKLVVVRSAWLAISVCVLLLWPCPTGAQVAKPTAATMDDYITCSLVYGALLQAAKRAGHQGMIMYTQPRLRAVLPHIESNRENSAAKRQLQILATELEGELRYRFVDQVSRAIEGGSAETLRAAMWRVERCDARLGIAATPLPLESKPQRMNAYLRGMLEGCVAKQTGAARPLPEALINRYCRCMVDQAAARGMGVTTTEQELGRVVAATHDQCFATIR